MKKRARLGPGPAFTTLLDARPMQPAMTGLQNVQMHRGMGRGALISGSFHLAIIVGAIITLHTLTSSQQDSGVYVNIEGLSQHGANGANGVDTKRPPTKDHLQPTKTPLNHQDREATPPMPTAPPLTDRTPPSSRPLATVRPPPPTVTQTPALVHLPPPRPHPPQPSKSTTTPPNTSLPTKPEASSAPDSATHQRNQVKTFVSFSPNLQTTIDKLRMQQNPDQAPTHPDEVIPAGPQGAVGSPTSSARSGLNASERNAIGQHVRPCFQVDAGALGLASFNVNLLVTTDGAGIARNAVVAKQDMDKMSNPDFAAFAGRAIDAVMNEECATLPLPAAMLGRNETLLFDFTP